MLKIRTLLIDHDLDYEKGGQLADHHITCRDDKHPMHKFVLFCRSECLWRQLFGSWMEAANSAEDFPTDSRQLIADLVKFLCTGEYCINVRMSRKGEPLTLDRWPCSLNDWRRVIKTEPSPYSNSSDDFTRFHMMLDVRMADLGQRLGMPHLYDLATTKSYSRCATLEPSLCPRRELLNFAPLHMRPSTFWNRAEQSVPHPESSLS